MSYFTTTTKRTTTLINDAPDWLREAVYEAHNGETPSEWVWSRCASIYRSLTEGFDVEEEIDSLTDIYYTDALDWLREDISRMGWVDDAMAEGLTDGTLGSALMAGQALAIRHIVSVLSEAYEANADE